MMTKVSNERAVAAFAGLQSLRNAQSEAVAVKALEWVEEKPGQRWYASGYEILAEQNFHKTLDAALLDSQKVVFSWRAPGELVRDFKECASLEAAKAAAQADFEQRIRSALTHAAPPLAGEWQPIVTADKSIAVDMQLPGAPRMLHSYPIWARSEGGRPFEASWVQRKVDAPDGYWWDWEGEDVADPDEWMPHPLTAALEAKPSVKASDTPFGHEYGEGMKLTDLVATLGAKQ